MHFPSRLVSAGLALSSCALASPVPNDPILKDKRSFVERDGVNVTVFEHAATGAVLEFVTNSGICETTPGVNQYSGYISVGTNMNMYESINIPVVPPSDKSKVVLVLRGSRESHNSSVVDLVQRRPRMLKHDRLVPRERALSLRRRCLHAFAESVQLQ